MGLWGKAIVSQRLIFSQKNQNALKIFALALQVRIFN